MELVAKGIPVLSARSLVPCRVTRSTNKCGGITTSLASPSTCPRRVTSGKKFPVITSPRAPSPCPLLIPESAGHVSRAASHFAQPPSRTSDGITYAAKAGGLAWQHDPDPFHRRGEAVISAAAKDSNVLIINSEQFHIMPTWRACLSGWDLGMEHPRIASGGRTGCHGLGDFPQASMRPDLSPGFWTFVALAAKVNLRCHGRLPGRAGSSHCAQLR